MCALLCSFGGCGCYKCVDVSDLEGRKPLNQSWQVFVGITAEWVSVFLMSFTLQRIKGGLQKAGDYQSNNLCFIVSWPKDHLSSNQGNEVECGDHNWSKNVFVYLFIFIKLLYFVVKTNNVVTLVLCKESQNPSGSAKTTALYMIKKIGCLCASTMEINRCDWELHKKL